MVRWKNSGWPQLGQRIYGSGVGLACSAAVSSSPKFSGYFCSSRWFNAARRLRQPGLSIHCRATCRNKVVNAGMIGQVASPGVQDPTRPICPPTKRGSFARCCVAAAEIRKSSLYNKFWLLRTTSHSAAGKVKVSMK